MAEGDAVVNTKGGSGKTLAVANLGGALLLRGLRVLLVDLDPQGSLTRMLDAAELSAGGGSGTLLLGDGAVRAPYRVVAHPTGCLELLPADRLLGRWQYEAMAMPPRLVAAAAALRGIAARYDVTLYDTPGATDASLRVALLAADVAVIALRVGADLDTDALADLYRVRAELTADGLAPVPLGGNFLPSNYHAGEAAQRDGLAALRAHFHGHVGAPIPHTPYLERSGNRGLPATLLYPEHAASRAYAEFALRLGRR